jgi:hypothetical protein
MNLFSAPRLLTLKSSNNLAVLIAKTEEKARKDNGKAKR